MGSLEKEMETQWKGVGVFEGYQKNKERSFQQLNIFLVAFEKNQYPSKEDKETLIKSIEERFTAKRTLLQINRWFQVRKHLEVSKNSDTLLLALS